MEQIPVKFFVSYSRRNKSLAGRFLDKFCEIVAPSKRYAYDFWRDSRILVGTEWHTEIQEALAQCNLGLILISPAFLGSKYITKHELPNFIGDQAKPVIPVMLQPIDFDLYDLKGLQKKQIFMLDTPNLKAPKSYGQCSAKQRYQFIMELFRQVERRLNKIF